MLPTTFAVARYLPDGSLDPAFGNDGAVTTDVDPQGPDVARAEALTPDGRIVAAGYTSPEELSRNVALAQYLPNGALDPEFANSGTQITTFLPTTGITNASIKSADRRAKFRFDAIGPVRGFECSLVRGAPTRPHFSSCGSPQAYKDLKRGHYTFEVRALFAGGGPDPNPASLRFSIR